MKKLLKLISVASVAAMLSCVLTSCSDKEGEPEEPDSSGNVVNPTLVNKNAYYFAGYWDTNKNKNFIFFPNKSAFLCNKDEGRVAQIGKWDYNEETNLLSTTLDNWQILITAQFEDQWTGVTLDGRSLSATLINDRAMETIFNAYETIHPGRWVDNNGETTRELSDAYYTSYTNLKFIDNAMMCDFTYGTGKYKDQGSIVIENAWSTNPTLIVKGHDCHIKVGTYKRKQ